LVQKIGWILGILAALSGLIPEVQMIICSELHAGMARNEPPRSADVVAVIGGGGGARIDRGLRLLKSGYAPQILFLGTTPEMEFGALVARGSRRWAPGRVRFGTRAAKNTRECVDELVAWCRRQRVGSVMVVSDDRHLGRIALHLDEHRVPNLETILVASHKVPIFDTWAQRLEVIREASAQALAWVVGLSAVLRL
jgi:uncharacterized SAM-binding protein YcdF (DUF218 family)